MSTHPDEFMRCEHGGPNRRKTRRSRSGHRHEHETVRQLFGGDEWPVIMETTIYEEWDIDPELHDLFHDDEALEQSFADALRKLSTEIGGVELDGELWRDEEFPEHTKPAIRVTAEIDSVEEYRELKERVYEIVRRAEHDDSVIYIFIDRQ